MKRTIRVLATAVLALVLAIGVLPSFASAEDGDSSEHVISGIPTDNVTVTVNGTAVTPDADGKITAKAGDEIRIAPAKNYEITAFQRSVLPDPIIVLNYPEDVWFDESGYQLLLDADHDLYPTLMHLSDGGNPDRFDIYGSFDGFEYFVPEDADYGANPVHAVYPGNSASATVPAGTYDLCIINGSEDGRIFFIGKSAAAGDLPEGRKDDMVFENGKTYEYVVSADEFGDYAALTVTETGEAELSDIGTAGADGSYSFTMPAEQVDLAVTLTAFRYELTEGEGSEFDPETAAALKFVFKRSLNDAVTLERFLSASVDGQELTEGADFTKSSGSLVIELEPSFLKTLSPGEHDLTVAFKDADSVSGTFTVAGETAPPVDDDDDPAEPETPDNKNPDTGDEAPLLPFILAAGLSAAVIGALIRRKRI